ncbi:hypothetical protein MKX01_040066 [Papaver californicum]|nr:hypothetical protein MKX01_040066 [Papaver californicum]
MRFLTNLTYNFNPIADQFQRAFKTSIVIDSIASSINDVSFKALKKCAIEILGPYSISYTFRRLAKRINQLQSGFVYHYSFAMLLGSTSFVTFLVCETLSLLG